jgi:hypothetical protein
VGVCMHVVMCICNAGIFFASLIGCCPFFRYVCYMQHYGSCVCYLLQVICVMMRTVCIVLNLNKSVQFLYKSACQWQVSNNR